MLQLVNPHIETTQRLRCRQHLLSLTEINLDQLQLLLATPDEGPGPHSHIVQLPHCYGYAVGLDGHRLGELVLGEDFQKAGHGVSLSEGRHEGSEGTVHGDGDGIGDLDTGGILAGYHGPALDGLVLHLAEQVGMTSSSFDWTEVVFFNFSNTF